MSNRHLVLYVLLVAACGGGPERRPPPPPEFFVPPDTPWSNPRAVQLRGRVLDPAGKPIANVAVLVIGGGHTGERPLTNAAGEFSVVGLPTTLAGYVAVHVPGYAVAVREPVRIAERNPDSVTLRLEPERVLTGRVVAADGLPLAHAKVEVRGERRLATPVRKGATWEQVAELDTVRTDAEGRFRFVGLYSGEFEVTARWPGVPECLASTKARSGAEGVEVRIDPEALGQVLLAGRVLDAATQAPIAGADVWVNGTSGPIPVLVFESSTHRQTITGADGGFALGLLPPRELHLSAGRKGSAGKAVTRVWPAGLHRIDLELEPDPR